MASASNIGWLKDLAASGKKVAALDKIPVLLPEARVYWDAYTTLSERRDWEMIGERRVPRFIPMSEIAAFCQMIPIFDLSDQQDFIHYCSVLDREYATYIRSKKLPTPPRTHGRGRK